MEYPSNSHMSKAKDNERHKIDKVVTGDVVTQKPSTAKKIAGHIIQEDTKNVGSYILFDIIIPTIKDTISSIVSNGVDMLLFGNDGKHGKSRRSSSNTSNISYINYNSISSAKSNKPEPSYNSYDQVNYDDITLSSRGEVMDVIYHMQDIIDEYGIISIADLYELVGLPSNYTDNKYGWTDIGGADAVRLRNGRYLLKLPKIRAID